MCIDPDYSRHYETRSVASEMFDGTWVGWTYYYGGGKHGQPEEMGWIRNSYEVTFIDEVKTITVRNFTKVEVDK